MKNEIAGNLNVDGEKQISRFKMTSVQRSSWLIILRTNVKSMTQFYPIDSKNLKDILHQLKSSSCCLDILQKGLTGDSVESFTDCELVSYVQCLSTGKKRQS